MKKQENNIFIRIASLFMAAFLIAGSLPAVNVQAAEKNVDTSKKGTLTITHYTADNEVAPGVNTKIYRVASVDENGYYTTVAPFDTETAFPIQNIIPYRSRAIGTNALNLQGITLRQIV